MYVYTYTNIIYINYLSSAKILTNVKLVVLTLFPNHLQKYQVQLLLQKLPK